MKLKNRVSVFVIYISLICCALTICANPIQAIASADNEVGILLQIDTPTMMVNNAERDIDPGRETAPVIQNGRTLVPIRAIMESFGGTVGWDNDTRTVTLDYRNDTIKLTIDSTLAYINDNPEILDVPPQIIDGRTMLPIRFVAEGFDFDVLWIADYSCIAISNYHAADSIVVPEAWKIGIMDSALKIHFIDVGQGDSIFSELPNGETLLIDAGPSKGIVNNYIKNLGYSSITYVVATHPDADHISGMPEILNSFPVNKFYMPEKEHTTKIFESMLNAVAANGCDAIYARAGNSIVQTDSLSIQFISPTKSYSDNNNASAVVKLTYKNNSFLFMGDAEVSAENDILNAGYDVSADVIKVGHHGSRSSTSDLFIKKVGPKYAVISVGKNNKYGHPTNEVLTVLFANNVDVYRTDELGTIIFTCDGNTYTIDKL